MEKYGKEILKPPGNFCSMLPIMHGIDSYSAYLLTKKTLYVRIFSVLLIFGVGCPTI